MVQQHILAAQRFKQRVGIVADAHLPRHERRIFQVRARRFFVEMEKPLQIDRPAARETPAIHPVQMWKPGARRCPGARQLRFPGAPRRLCGAAPPASRWRPASVRAFFLFQIEIAVARDAKRRGRQNLVAAIELRRVGGDDVLQKNIMNAAVFGGNAQQDEEARAAR